MRHFIVAAALLLAALIVTLGAATMLENMAAATRQPETEPFIPGTPEPAKRPPMPEQSRSLKLVARHD
jgi:hypothetical protein